MPVDIIVKNPERIRKLGEVEDILSRILTYEQETGNCAGVLKMQNRQIGAIHYIISQREAEKEINKPVLNEPRTCEWGVKFYPHSYFEELRERLNGNR